MADQRLPFLTQEVEIPPPSTSNSTAKFNTYFFLPLLLYP